MSSNAPDGKKWIVTKAVDIKGKPVCWCIPVEVKTGKQIEVTLNESNIFDLRTTYDNVMREPIDFGDKEQMKQLVRDYIREKLPEITRETIEWGEVTKAANGNSSIHYKYRAKIQDKNTKVMDQIFTFDANGNFVSVKDVDSSPQN